MTDTGRRMVLAGDIGGTNTRLALYRPASGPDSPAPSCLLLRSFPSNQAETLADIVAPFLAEHAAGAEVAAACFGVPGPVSNGQVRLTNLPWQLDEVDLAKDLELPAVRLVNDHMATITALPLLQGTDLLTIHAGSETRDKRTYAVLAPGTGLGQAFLHIDDAGVRHRLPSEGGHVAFAPTCEVQVALFNHMRRQFGHRVSMDRVLSGPGIVTIHEFLRDSGRWDEPLLLRRELQAAQHPAAVITSHGIRGDYPICVRTLDIFSAMLGAHAGDVVLSMMATGGIYLAGGIAPRIADYLHRSCMMDTYRDKGRLSYLVEATPLAIIMHDHPAVLGAAAIASDLC